MIAPALTERRQAARTWGREFGRALAEAQARTLVSLISAIYRPTLRDLLTYVGEGMYDPDGPERVEVHIGDLVGGHGQGPSVACVVAALEGLPPSDLEVALGWEIASLLADSMRWASPLALADARS